jgi:hypothetical protein
MPFFAPFATYIKGAAKSLCTSSNTVDAVLSELENAAAGGRQDFVRDIMHVVLMAFAFRTVPRSTSEDVLLSVVMATHPKASVLLSCYCSRIRTGDYPCSRSEILAQVARFCERNDHPTGGYRDLQSMLGAQEGLVDAVLAEIEESDDGLGILYRLLGYCAISCTDDALPRIAKAAGGSKSNLLRCGGEDMGEYIVLETTVALRALSAETPPNCYDLVFPPMARLISPQQREIKSFASLLDIVDSQIGIYPDNFRTIAQQALGDLWMERLQALSLTLPKFVERERAAEEAAQNAALAAEDSLLAELDAEEAAKKTGAGKKKKKKKKKSSSGKKGEGGQQAESADGLTDFQRYEQSEQKQEVERRKRERNLEEAARVMAAHAKKTQVVTAEGIEAQIAALELPLAETAEDIEAQIAALGPPPDFPPPPPPAAPRRARPAPPPPPPPPSRQVPQGDRGRSPCRGVWRRGPAAAGRDPAGGVEEARERARVRRYGHRGRAY